jgi:hypothetical protein
MDTTQKVLEKEDKRKIIDYTLNNLAKSALIGGVTGGSVSILFKRRALGIFIFSYFIGKSLAESNNYLADQLKYI